MNILFVSDSYFPHVNGVSYFVRRLAALLQQNGHQVWLLVPSANSYHTYQVQDGLPVYGVPYRWSFSIQDSGPGLPPTTVGVLGQQLRPTVEPTSVMDPDQAEPVTVTPEGLPQIPNPTDIAATTRSTPGGEGVGLQIVKRLCELLDANLDVETKAGQGTLFRIRLPQNVNR